jgi:branched-chain amino acid transport system substrate-binding protein
MKVLRPEIEVKTSQMPKLMAGQFGAEITTLLGSGAEVVHSSLWGGDLEGLVLQGAPRGLFEKHKVILSAGEPAINRLGTRIPEGTIIGARGPFGPFAPDSEVARWLKAAYQDRYQVPPNYASFKMAQAILGVKAAYEKAKPGDAFDQERIIAALENLTFEGPGGAVKMSLGKGHQAVMDAAVGTTKNDGSQLKVVDITRYPADKVNPPDGIKSEAWIRSSLKAK